MVVDVKEDSDLRLDFRMVVVVVVVVVGGGGRLEGVGIVRVAGSERIEVLVSFALSFVGVAVFLTKGVSNDDRFFLGDGVEDDNSATVVVDTSATVVLLLLLLPLCKLCTLCTLCTLLPTSLPPILPRDPAVPKSSDESLLRRRGCCCGGCSGGGCPLTVVPLALGLALALGLLALALDIVVPLVFKAIGFCSKGGCTTVLLCRSSDSDCAVPNY